MEESATEQLDGSSEDVSTLAGGVNYLAIDGHNAPAPFSQHSSEATQQIQHLASQLQSNDVIVLTEAANALNTLLCANNPPIQETIETGVVPRLLQLTDHENESLAYTAMWSLSNLASGTTLQARLLLDQGAAYVLKRGLDHPQLRMREQACWALGNLAGDGEEMRDAVLAAGVMPLILELCSSTKLSVARTAVWAISNLCRGSPPPARSDVESALPILGRLLFSSDSDVVVDALWSVSMLAKGDSSNQTQVSQIPQLVSRVAAIVAQPQPQLPVIVPALQILGHLASGPDETARSVLDSGILTALPSLCTHNRRGVRKDAFWLLSNLLAGPLEHIELCRDVIPLAMQAFQQGMPGTDPAWCIINALSYAYQHVELLNYVFQHDPLPGFQWIYTSGGDDLISSASETLKSIVKYQQDAFQAILTPETAEQLLDLIQSTTTEPTAAAIHVLDFLAVFLGIEDDSSIIPSQTHIVEVPLNAQNPPFAWGFLPPNKNLGI